jgi:hypothetical protein
MNLNDAFLALHWSVVEKMTYDEIWTLTDAHIEFLIDTIDTENPSPEQFQMRVDILNLWFTA